MKMIVLFHPLNYLHFLVVWNLLISLQISARYVEVDANGLVNDVPFNGVSAQSSYEAASVVNYFEAYASVFEQKRM